MICYCDGGGNNKTKSDFYGSIKIGDSDIISFDFLGISSTNEAEYQTMELLFEYINKLDTLSDRKIEVYSDSKLVVNQVNKLWKIRAKNLERFNLRIITLIQEIKNKHSNIDIKINWTPRKNIVKVLGH